VQARYQGQFLLPLFLLLLEWKGEGVFSVVPMGGSEVHFLVLRDLNTDLSIPVLLLVGVTDGDHLLEIVLGMVTF
jgi:hypothetical protein